jgi:UDP-N-acetylmuramyl pentapeptide phosphotransferase/UDP-N-acetylglucosamine-1-phosphate transferase
LLTQRHADVSAFVALLICVHPITEVLFSILRRTIKKTHPGQPDRLHLHSLLKARYVRRWFKGRSMTYQNSATGLLVGGFSLIPVTIAQFVYNSTRWSVVAVFVFVCIYIALYARMVRFRWTSPVSFLFKRRR